MPANGFPRSILSWTEYQRSSIHFEPVLVPHPFRFCFWCCKDHVFGTHAPMLCISRTKLKEEVAGGV
jgi:hypothetical protein